MNIYRLSGRFAAVCAARSETPIIPSNPPINGDLCPPPTPCSSIRDRQVLNRTPILSNTNNTQSQYYSGHLSRSSQPSSCHSISRRFIPIDVQNFRYFSIDSTSTLMNEENNGDKNDNDENSPIKSASYMDELRQRLERVLNDPASPIPSPSSPTPSQTIPIPIERQSCLPISKSFRLPTQPLPTPVQSSAGHRPPIVSRLPLKPTSSSLQTPNNHLIPPPPRGIIRGPILIAPLKLRSNHNVQCLSSSENLRTSNSSANHPTPTITIGSTPLPRKQLPTFHTNDRNSSYRTTNGTHTYGHQYHFTNGNHSHQMSKSFIMPSKHDGKSFCSNLFPFIFLSYRSS